MKLRQAIKEIKKAMKGMQLQSRESVFDEWLILAKNAQWFDVLHHSKSGFLKKNDEIDFDIQLLAGELNKSSYTTGEYFFSMEAPGSLYDAFMVAGPDRYIIFNNTIKSMSDISADPLWVNCQTRFVELSELFRRDCLE